MIFIIVIFVIYYYIEFKKNWKCSWCSLSGLYTPTLRRGPLGNRVSYIINNIYRYILYDNNLNLNNIYIYIYINQLDIM